MAVLLRNPKTITRTTTCSIKPLSSCISRSFSSTTLNSETDLKVPSFFSCISPPLRQEPKDRNVQWVFLGCPGVGKGTYASRLSNLLGIPHIATGDLVREELNSSGTLSSQVLNLGVLNFRVSYFFLELWIFAVEICIVTLLILPELNCIVKFIDSVKDCVFVEIVTSTVTCLIFLFLMRKNPRYYHGWAPHDGTAFVLSW